MEYPHRPPHVYLLWSYQLGLHASMVARWYTHRLSRQRRDAADLAGCLTGSVGKRLMLKNAAYPKAIAALKANGTLPEAVELRQVQDLNNIVEQDHRFIKRRVKPGLGFFSFETAWNTLQGYEVMNLVRKGQMRGVEKGDILGQVAFIACLFGVAA